VKENPDYDLIPAHFVKNSEYFDSRYKSKLTNDFVAAPIALSFFNPVLAGILASTTRKMAISAPML
jgi:hypothetical protein